MHARRKKLVSDKLKKTWRNKKLERHVIVSRSSLWATIMSAIKLLDVKTYSTSEDLFIANHTRKPAIQTYICDAFFPRNLYGGHEVRALQESYTIIVWFHKDFQLSMRSEIHSILLPVFNAKRNLSLYDFTQFSNFPCEIHPTLLPAFSEKWGLALYNIDFQYIMSWNINFKWYVV